MAEGFQFVSWQEPDFYFHQSVQTDILTHPVSCLVDTRVFSPGIEGSKHELNPTAGVEVKRQAMYV